MVLVDVAEVDGEVLTLVCQEAMEAILAVVEEEAVLVV